MGFPNSYQEAIRWVRWKNLSRHDCPAYGCIQLMNQEDRFGYVHLPPWAFKRGPANSTAWLSNPAHDNIFVYGWRPYDSTALRRQDASQFMFNGPEPVKAGQWGRCTNDWPAAALHNQNPDPANAAQTDYGGLWSDLLLAPGGECGPVVDSWIISADGHAFRAWHHDLTCPVARYSLTGDQLHVTWVVPNPRIGQRCISGEGGYYAPALEGQSLFNNMFRWHEHPGHWFTTGATVDGDVYIEVPETNVYSGHASATFGPSSDLVGMQLYYQNGAIASPSFPDTEQATLWNGWRQASDMYRESGYVDPTAHPSGKENVAFSFLQEFDEGNRLLIRNLAEVNVASFHFIITCERLEAST